MDFFLAAFIPFVLATIIMRIFDYNEKLKLQEIKVDTLENRDVNKR